MQSILIFFDTLVAKYIKKNREHTPNACIMKTSVNKCIFFLLCVSIFFFFNIYFGWQGKNNDSAYKNKNKKREARREEKAEKAAILDKVFLSVLLHLSFDYPNSPLQLLTLVDFS